MKKRELILNKKKNKSGKVSQTRASHRDTDSLTRNTHSFTCSRKAASKYIHSRGVDCVQYTVPGVDGVQ